MRHLMLRCQAALMASGLLLVLVLQVWAALPARAVSLTDTIRPVSTIASNGLWAGTGTGGSSCSGLCDYVDEVTSDGDTSYLNGPPAQAPSVELGLGGSTNSGQTASSITVHIVGRANTNAIGYGNTDIVLRIGGVLQAQQSVQFKGNTYQDLSVTFTGTWSKSDVDGASVIISKTVNGLVPAQLLSTIYATVAYTSPALTQNASRFYGNTNSSTPGAALAATNTVSEIATNTPFRLRMGVSVLDIDWTTGAWGPHNNTYKLQYATLTAGSCAAQSTGWTDITGATGVRWYDNASVANNASISNIGGGSDPTVTGTANPQTYRESNGFTNTSTITNGNTGVWDFSLTTSGLSAGSSQCFRIIKNDGTALDSYSSYPQLTLLGTLDVAIVDGSGNPVATPTVAFPAVQAATKACRINTTSLGVSTQKIRVTNNLTTGGWNLSIAATNGPSSLWTSGSNVYDFNDIGDGSGCVDGPDSDTVGGVLAVQANLSTVTPQAGCTGSFSKPADAGFSDATPALTIISTTSSQRFCYWDVTGVGLFETIPPQTPPGNYSISMTLTVTAQ